MSNFICELQCLVVAIRNSRIQNGHAEGRLLLLAMKTFLPIYFKKCIRNGSPEQLPHNL